MQDGRFVQEGQPHEIVDRRDVSFVSSFDAVLECGRIFEGKFSSAADEAWTWTLKPSTASTTAGSQTSEAWRIQTRSPGWAIRLYASRRVDLQPWPIQGKLETTASRATPAQVALAEYSRAVASPRNPETDDLRCRAARFFADLQPS